MKVMELALFKLKDGVTEDQLRSALADSNRWLAAQPGFIQRRHGAGDEGLMDLVEWQDMAAARTAAENFMRAPEACSFMEVIDPGTVVMRHFTQMS